MCNEQTGEIQMCFLCIIHPAAAGHAEWVENAAKELITLLRDDYPALMAVLGALSDAHITLENPHTPAGDAGHTGTGGKR